MSDLGDEPIVFSNVVFRPSAYGLTSLLLCGCKARATVGRFCVYCAHATDQGRRSRGVQDALTAEEVKGLDAERRLVTASERQEKRAPQTASSRERAKAHPWECDE